MDRVNIARIEVEPFMYEPSTGCTVSDESFSSSDQESISEEEKLPDINLERIGNTDWYVLYVYSQLKSRILDILPLNDQPPRNGPTLVGMAYTEVNP